MGLIHATVGAVSGVLADQWKEYFYCEALSENVIVAKGKKRTSVRSSNYKGSDNIISDGSVIAVADGQCMIIVEQGKVFDICSEPGEYIFNSSTSPSIFTSGLSDGIKDIFNQIGGRIGFGGLVANDQRIYYFNTKEIMGNKYGTSSPVPFRIVDNNIGLDLDTSIRCFGEYSYRVTNPILFYTNVCGNVDNVFTRDKIDSQMKTELLTALQPALAKISDMGVRYSSIPAHTKELANLLNKELSPEWKNKRGIEVVSFGISSLKISEEDEATIKTLQKNAVLRNTSMAAATITSAQAEAMKAAASNTAAGPMAAFMGMNMAMNAGGMNAGGMNAQSLYQMSQQNQISQQVGQSSGIVCQNCGARNTGGKFCIECGKPLVSNDWVCQKCGHTGNTGKFCQNCGSPRVTRVYKCDKCGWTPKDLSNLPKFCPECGDPFNDADLL